MKFKHPDRVDPHPAESHPDSTQPMVNPETRYATVYTFVIYDHDKGATTIYPRMATREAIAKMRGKVNEETAWVVEASELDIEGFYSGTSSGP